MNLDMINPHVMKIIVAAREEDSIKAIAKRVGLSYGWTQKWVKELVKEGVFKEKWRGVILQEKNITYQEIIKFIKKSVNEVSLYYAILQLSGICYCFTKTDAVYIWTEGRYNIARYKNFYPIFIKIHQKDYDLFIKYCKKLQLRINDKKNAFYVPERVNSITAISKNNFFVEPLDNTINFMKKNIYNFEPALEMIDEMYEKNLKIKYKEVNSL